MGEQRQKKVSEEDALKDAEKTINALKKQEVDSTKNTAEKKPASKTSAIRKTWQRSMKYKKILENFERAKKYPIDEALELIKKTSYSKFDGSVEVHINLEKTKKGETIRELIKLPHGTGKIIKAAVIDEKLAEKILKDKRTDFDILLATPQMMPKIGRIAKILGPQGKMPNPKSGTVTADPEKSLEEIKKGRTEFKADKQNIIHLVIGKTSWDSKKLMENYQVLMNSLTGKKLQSVTICATMGPGIKIAL